MIRSRLLLAIDQSGSGDAAIDFTIGHAAPSGARVVVLHVRELPSSLRLPTLETVGAARDLVESTLLHIREAGIDGSGLIISAREDAVAKRIVQLAAEEQCDAIILGSRRRRGIRRLTGSRIRERVVRSSHLPVIVAPPGLHHPRRGMSTPLSGAARP